MQADKPGGRSNPNCGGTAAGAAGSRLAGEKLQTWTFAVFPTYQSRPTGWGCPSPFERFMKGLRP